MIRENKWRGLALVEGGVSVYLRRTAPTWVGGERNEIKLILRDMRLILSVCASTVEHFGLKALKVWQP